MAIVTIFETACLSLSTHYKSHKYIFSENEIILAVYVILTATKDRRIRFLNLFLLVRVAVLMVVGGVVVFFDSVAASRTHLTTSQRANIIIISVKICVKHRNNEGTRQNYSITT